MKMVINPIGGLANRMRAIASALMLARNTDYDCEIVWPVNKELYSPFERLFELVPELPSVTDISATADFWIYGYPRKKNLFISRLFQSRRFGSKIMPEVNYNINISDPESVQRILSKAGGKDVLIRTGLEFYPFEADFYRSLFQPKADIIAEARRRVPAAGNFIGLHIRRTDNQQAIRFSPLNLFTSKIEEHLDADSSVKFYLATDDESVKRELWKQFGERIIYSSQEARRDSEEGIREGLIEMVALSFTGMIYGSYWSSFSEAAAMLGNVPLIQLSCKK